MMSDSAIYCCHSEKGKAAMNVSLTPELERLVNEKIKTGMYQTASEVVREALRLLQQRDEQRGQLRADIRAGLEEIRRDRFSEHEARSGAAPPASVFGGK